MGGRVRADAVCKAVGVGVSAEAMFGSIAVAVERAVATLKNSLLSVA